MRKPRARIVPAEAWHAELIAQDPRPADVAELWSAGRHTPLEALLVGLRASAEPMTGMWGDEPVCMFGASPFSIMGGMGTAWMIGSRALDRYSVQRSLLLLSVPAVEYMQAQFPRLLYNFVDARNLAAIRWLRWLGFQFGDPIPYGVDGLPFLPFYRYRGQ